MKIEKRDWERVMEKLEKNMKINKRYISDMPKYMYWSEKSSEYIDLMNENKDDKSKWLEYWRESLLCEFEKNKYCRLSRKEFILLLTMLKAYNMQVKENKLYMNEHGHRVRYKVASQ